MHVKDKTPKDKLSNLVYGITCGDEDCTETYVGETKQALKARMRQHRKPNILEAQNSVVFNHLVKENHTFDIDNDVTILDREADWRRRGIKEAIYERIENPTLNRRGGLRFNLPHSWDVVLKGVPRRLPHNKTLVGDSTGHST